MLFRSATIGPKLEKLLTKAKSVQEDMPAILDIARKAEKAGIDLDPIMQGAMTPEGREAFRELSMSKNTKVGAEVNASLENLRNKAEESILNVFGKTPDNLEKSSNAELGDKLRSTISESIDPIAKRANEAYESLNKTDKVLELTPTAKASIIGNLEKFGLENTFKLSGTEESSVFNTLNKRIEKANTINDLKTALSEAVKNAPMSMSQDIKALRDVIEDNAYNSVLEGKGEKLINATREARDLYASAKSDLRQLGDIVGLDIDRMSPRMFSELLSDPMNISSESLIKKLGNPKNIATINYVKENFPNATEILQEYHRNRIPLRSLKSGELNVNAIFSALTDPNKMPKEIRDFAFTPEQLNKLLSVKDVLEAIPPKMGPSGTPEGIRSIYRNLFTTLGGLIGFTTGKGILGLIAGRGLQYATQEVPQAMKLASLKMLGGAESVSASGFDAMFKAARAAIRGTEKLNGAVERLFKPGAPVLESSMMPTSKSLGLLHTSMLAVQQDPSKVADAQGDLGHYMPNHSVALSSTLGRASQVLSEFRPNTGKTGPLDPPRQPSKAEIAKYKRALEIVEQPMMILEHIKNGTITPDDLRVFNSVYPSIADTFRQKINEQLVNQISKNKTIPYKTQLGLSLFMGQPLSSSEAPQNIMANQSIYLPPPTPPMKGRAKGPSPSAFKDVFKTQATPMQMREQTKRK